MKLLLLLSDESQIVQQRDRALKDVRKDAEESKRKVAELLNDLLLKDTPGTLDSVAGHSKAEELFNELGL